MCNVKMIQLFYNDTAKYDISVQTRKYGPTGVIDLFNVHLVYDLILRCIYILKHWYHLYFCYAESKWDTTYVYEKFS